MERKEKGKDMVLIHLLIPVAMKKALLREAKKRGVSMSELVRQGIDCILSKRKASE